MLALALFQLWSADLSYSQWITAGVKGGGVLQEIPGSAFDRDFSDESKRYTFGPMVDLRLPLGFGIEVDALYRRIGSTQTIFFRPFYHVFRERINSWEFPAIVKYRVPAGISHPYAGIGYTVRVLNGFQELSGAGPEPATRSDFGYKPQQGIVFVGGVEFERSHLRFAPEIRYSHWTGLSPLEPGEVQFLIGITWR